MMSEDAQSQPAEPNPGAPPKTVLVVDDSRAIRGILSRMMTELGFKPSGAEHGAAALSALDNGPAPDLILLDWEMPVMNGVEFLRALRQRPSADANIPVIMITTLNTAEQLSEALQAGASEYLMKPVEKGMLEAKLEFLGLR